MNRPFSPPPTQDSRPNYIVLCDYKNLGHVFINEVDDTRATIVDMIASGEWENVVSVKELLPAEAPGKPGMWNEIVEDIAREVLDKLAADQLPLSWEMRNWLHGRHPAGFLSTRGMVAA